MWVQPKFGQPIFLLKPIRATAYRFYNKTRRGLKEAGEAVWFLCSVVLVQENKLQ